MTRLTKYMQQARHRSGMLIKTFLLSNMICLGTAYAQNGGRNTAPEATAAEAAMDFRDISYLKEAYIDPTPADRKDGIHVGELGTNGVNKAMLIKLAQEIADHEHGNYDGLLIVHKGKLVFESYYKRGRIDLPHPQASATKAYTALALGRAIQMGYLTMADLDKPLVSFLKDLDPTQFVEGVDKITLHQALTMRGGLRISDEQREAFEQNPDPLKGQGLVQTLFEQSAPITSASQPFAYGNYNPTLVMQVIEAVVPGSAEDFIKAELLDKLGITNYSWPTDISGLPRAGSRSNMTSRDMVKWGLLAMNKGRWNSEQLIPEAYITKAIHRIVTNGDEENFDDHGDVSNIGYGYFWWQADLKAGDKRYFSTSAQGGSGQTIILIEELDLIVVSTVHRLETSVLQMTAERILPAFIN